MLLNDCREQILGQRQRTERSYLTVVLWAFSVFGQMHMYRNKKWEEKHIKQFCSYDRANNNWRHGYGALKTLLPFDISYTDLFSTFSSCNLCCVSFHFSSYFYRANFCVLYSEYLAVCVRGITVLMQVQPWRW